VDTPVGKIPKVSTTLQFSDRLGAWKARWSIGRMRYRVEPGLYAVGNPNPESPVLVSANYKMSFDRLRSELSSLDAWILVLNTKGINVWCSAGKGTFSADEVVKRIQEVGLEKVVSHRRVILPQLSASGVRAHEVLRQGKFKVMYGPIRAADLPKYLKSDMTATPQMRQVRFQIRDRIILVPTEIMAFLKYALLGAVILFVLSGLNSHGFSVPRMVAVGSWSALLLLATYLVAAALTPALLPWLPGRAFSLKGAWIGLLVSLIAVGITWSRHQVSNNPFTAVSRFLILPAVASFVAMNFTGASTYTSLSGVKKEMRVAVPLQIVSVALGLGLWIVGRFV
jgi:acetyl-CoA decarbonylase/synthase complex subunit gamma